MGTARYRDLKTSKLVDPQDLDKCKEGYLIERPVATDFDGSPIWPEDQKVKISLTLTQEDAKNFLLRLNLLDNTVGLYDEFINIRKQINDQLYDPKKICEKELKKY